MRVSRKSIPLAVRDAVVLRDRGRCRYCGHRARPIHLDHVVPVSKGGGDEISNLVVACVSCNYRKADQIWTPRRIGKPPIEKPWRTHAQFRRDAISASKRRTAKAISQGMVRESKAAKKARAAKEASLEAERRREALHAENLALRARLSPNS
jgi:HNH endonuclease